MIRPFATRGYVDGKCADLAVRLRRKPVFRFTAVAGVGRGGGNVSTFLFNHNNTYQAVAPGRIIRIYLHTRTRENVSVGVWINSEQQHILRKKNYTAN